MKLLLFSLLACASVVHAQEFAETPITRATRVPETALPPPVVPDASRFNDFFEPLRTDRAAISPDGRFLAFSIREDDKLYVVTADLDHPDAARAKVVVADDATSTPAQIAHQFEKTPARILWMAWATPERLVIQTNRSTDTAVGMPPRWLSVSGVVLGFDVDGKNAGVLVSPKDLGDSQLDLPKSPLVERFAIDRADRSFEQRVNTPDRPMETDTSGGKFGNDVTADTANLATPEEAAANIVSERPGAVPRTLRVLRLDPERAGAVHLLATGTGSSRSLQLFSADASTGKLRLIASDQVREDRDFLLDQQGLLRITIPNSVLGKFPLRYDYLGRKAGGAGKPLAQTMGAGEFSISPENFFGERELPLGFDPTGDVLFYASNRGRDTFAVYSRNLSTGQTGKVAFENLHFDLIGAPTDAFPPDTLVFDPHTQELAGIRYEAAMRTTAWLRPEWRDAQATLEKLLPGLAVDIVDWDTSGRRFIVATQGPADGGAFFVYDREKSKLSQFARRAPWLDAKRTFATVPFYFARPDGALITGLVTVPTTPRLKPYPMVIVCPDVPWQRVSSNFRTEIHALADMGFAVVQINGRGAWGLGIKHRDALKAGYDLVQIDDILRTIDELEKRFQVNRDRVALFGRGHGGFIALRALQDHPERFRCAVAMDAPIDLQSWLREQYWNEGAAFPQLVRGAFGDAARLDAAPLRRHPEQIKKPVLLLSFPGREGELRRGQYLAARAFAAAAEKNAEVDFADLPTDYTRGLPRARAGTFAKVEEFLNLHIYSYKVKPGEVREVKASAK
ncbi:MAG: alpha/beta fold hydrolase [Opitutae bacterium]|nr:alpha/beta fold hydrolase [Opitutae bacterium]